MILVHYLYNYLKSWTRGGRASLSVLISVSLLSSLICLRLTDGRPSAGDSSTAFIPAPANVNTPESLITNLLAAEEDETSGAEFKLTHDTKTHSASASSPDEPTTSGGTDQEALDKMREGILGELGLNAESFTNKSIPKVNISRKEYVRAYTEYMFNVRRRRSLERTQHFGAKERRRNAILRVEDFEDVSTTNAHDILKPEINQSLTSMRKRIAFDIQLDLIANFQPRIQRAILHLPPGCFLEDGRNNETTEGENWRSEVEVTQNLTMWSLRESTSPSISPGLFSLTSFCFANHTGNTDRSSLKVISRHLPSSENRSGRSRRSLESSSPLLQKYQNKANIGQTRDCDKTRHGKTCCRRSLRINFSDLQINEVICEPKEFDAFMCNGRCNARRVPYATTHAMFQHTLHQTRGKKLVPRPCCTPTRLTNLDVIHKIPGSTLLQVTILSNAIVQECGCS